MPRATSQKYSRNHTQTNSGPRNNAQSTNSAASGPAGTRSVLNNTNLGQHILVNPMIAQTIVEKGNLRNTDVVMEVGPGTGNLTVKMLEQAKSVIAIEKDPRMAAELQKRVMGTPQITKLNIIIGDFCDAELPPFDVMIANTPYQISSPLVFKILSHRPLFRCAILMFQLEFCNRLCAKPGSGNFTRLSANVQLYAKVDLIMKVGKGNFRPPPEVESGVVRIVPLDPPPAIKFEEFDGLTRILFSRSNRTCRKSFGAKGVFEMLQTNYDAWLAENPQALHQTEGISDGMAIDGHNGSPPANTMKQRVDAILVKTGYAEERASKMDVDDFLALLSAFHDQGIHFS